MGYCQVSDIIGEFKSIVFTSSSASSPSAVTLESVGTFITQASSMIDGRIQNRYSVPVTGTASLIMLKAICIMLIKARIISIYANKGPVDKTKQDPDGRTLNDAAIKLIDQICNGVLKLIDAQAVNTEAGMTSYLSKQDLVYDYQVDTDAW